MNEIILDTNEIENQCVNYKTCLKDGLIYCARLMAKKEGKRITQAQYNQCARNCLQKIRGLIPCMMEASLLARNSSDLREQAIYLIDRAQSAISMADWLDQQAKLKETKSF